MELGKLGIIIQLLQQEINFRLESRHICLTASDGMLRGGVGVVEVSVVIVEGAGANRSRRWYDR